MFSFKKLLDNAEITANKYLQPTLETTRIRVSSGAYKIVAGIGTRVSKSI